MNRQHSRRAILVCHHRNSLAFVHVALSLMIQNIQNGFYADFYQVQLVQCVLTVFGVAQTIEGAWAIFTPNLTCYGSYEEEGGQ